MRSNESPLSVASKLCYIYQHATRCAIERIQWRAAIGVSGNQGSKALELKANPKKWVQKYQKGSDLRNLTLEFYQELCYNKRAKLIAR